MPEVKTLENPKRYDYIDALRGLAVLGVLLVHTFQKVPSGKMLIWLGTMINQGARGVQLFYIVSAFTLFLSMYARKDREKNPVLNFFIRRFFRIAPLFYLAIFYYLWQDGLGPRYWLGDAPMITWSNIISTFTFTNGFYPYWITSVVPGGWTIATEMMFYFCLPFFFRAITSLKKAIFATVISIITLNILQNILSAHVMISDKDLWNNYLFLYFPSQLPVFMLGIVLFFVVKAIRNGELEKSFKESSVAMLFVAVIIMVNASFNSIFLPQHLMFGISFIILAYSLYIGAGKIFVNKFMVYIGTISFSMYLSHFAVLHYLDKFNFLILVRSEYINFLLVYFLLIIFSAAVSTVTYTLVEKPAQKIGKKIISFLEANEAPSFIRFVRQWALAKMRID